MNNDSFFTEIWTPEGSAFSLEIEEKLHEEQSEFQKIEIYRTRHWGNLMVLDGCYMVTDRDNFLYHEMMTHPVLFTHTNPRKVVVIGGGDCGALKEVLKHPNVTEAWQVEIDERVTRLSEQYFPDLCSSNSDPRAHFYFGDGIQWIKDAEPGSIDIIIVDSTDPVGPAEGLFNKAFFETCLRALGDNGILVQQSESPLFHSQTIIRDMIAEMRQAGFCHFQTLPFPQPIYPSGWWSCTMASKNVSVNEFRYDHAQEKVFATHYYNADLHRGAMALPEFMKRDLEQ
ncbi:polyamine aminopropyltransferase [Gynuella sunshinyii]|uniref:Polyamine aminopropyltransferase n=1 Tax=Gynuella sunshinyii YC6258 TaxID=1445510 RepID=A0A0C5VPN3_9GAMM|nr:polyamine aminopropyltransferase [Gynuella sunshinyii]AJQ92214.1 spermidine synthase [Gynuella sunshinyii YC6258]